MSASLIGGMLGVLLEAFIQHHHRGERQSDRHTLYRSADWLDVHTAWRDFDI